ncbi:hypothetical protein [Kitasatospora acidiphila]|uniref:hypothetical protein n=1 Tax=Kitasatospora acidiphila TaxID=2567942 RepID=UPI003C7469D7
MTTDQNPHDGGPGDTPVERLLREALNARASLVSPHNLRPAQPPNRRIRRLKPVYAAVLPLGVAAAVTIGFVGFRSNTVADHVKPAPASSIPASHRAAASPSSSTSAPPSPSTSPSTSASDSPGVASDAPSGSASGQPSAPTTASSGDAQESVPVSLGPAQSYRGVKYQLPSGWFTSVANMNNNSICLAAPDSKVTVNHADCGPDGIELTAYSTADEVSEAVYPQVSDLDSDQAWSHQPYCYDPQNQHDGAVSLASYDKTAVSLSAGQADLATWNVNCTGGGQFTARMWGFRQQQVLVAVRGLDPKYEATVQAVLNSLDLSGHPQPIQANVSITTSGLGQGSQPVPDDNSKVPFSVTFTNSAGSPLLQPLIPDVQVSGISAATLDPGTFEEQLDDGSWVDLGMIYSPWSNPKIPSIQLAPGASKTINYRISFAPAANFAQLKPTLVERAFLISSGGSRSQVGGATMPVPTVAK